MLGFNGLQVGESGLLNAINVSSWSVITLLLWAVFCGVNQNLSSALKSLIVKVLGVLRKSKCGAYCYCHEQDEGM